MASVPAVTLDKVDAAICAVSDRLVVNAQHTPLEVLCPAFREFAAGVSMLLGLIPVPEGAVVNAPTEETS